jgi:TRAP-type uncharacterized transport system fused permease subunit
MLDRVVKVRAAIAAAAIFGLPVFAFINVWFPTIPLVERAVIAVLGAVAYFTSTEHREWRLVAADSVHAVLSVVAFGFLAVEWYDILSRQGEPTFWDITFGIVGVYLVLVATYRTLGTGLTAIIIVFLAYTFLGQYLPVWLGGHRGYSISRAFTFFYINENGMMGFAIEAALKYMALFLVLGKVLQYSGALKFIMDLSRAAFRGGKTGPPLMAVFSNALVGTVSGSAMSDVYVTGQVVIPMMKRIGIRPELAAAITATAANGAQIMPPVMGFAVFFMVTLLDVSYFEIIVAAIIPGCLYFSTVGVAVWTRVRNLPLSSPSSSGVEDAPTWSKAFGQVGALSFPATIATLTYVL